MGKKTVAELLVETLVSREVPRIYGVAGDSLNGITDSIRRQYAARVVDELAAPDAGLTCDTGPRQYGRPAI